MILEFNPEGNLLYYKTRYISLYKFRLVVVSADDIEALQSLIPEFEDREIFGHCWRHGYRGQDAIYLIFNFNNPHGKITHGVVSHEITHAVSMIFEARGILHDPNNDEPAAYLNEYLTNHTYKMLRDMGYKPCSKY